MEQHKLFVVVRADLPPGAQLAQSVHAALAFGIRHEDRTRSWHSGSNNLVVLAIPDRAALERLYDAASCVTTLATARFHEPDFEGELTAVALHGTGAHRLVSSLPLALRPSRVAA